MSLSIFKEPLYLSLAVGKPLCKWSIEFVVFVRCFFNEGAPAHQSVATRHRHPADSFQLDVFVLAVENVTHAVALVSPKGSMGICTHL